METNASDRSHYTVLAAVFLLFFLLFFTPFRGANYDDVGYYVYLSSFLFDGDVDITNDWALSNSNLRAIETKLSVIGSKGLVGNEYAIGNAILWCPFHLPVRVVAWISGLVIDPPPAWTADRYSAPYLLAVSFATVCYGCLTLFLIYATCRVQYRPAVSLLATLGVTLASPLPHYVFGEPGMSHAQSAFSVSLLLLLCFRHRNFECAGSYLLVAAALALATLVRWQNIVFACVPAGFWLEHRLRCGDERLRRKHGVRLVLATAAFLVLFSIQMFYWWAQQGKFITMPQGPQYMAWTSPKFIKLLFSGWHGLYYTHPLLLVASVGFVVYAVQNRRRPSSYGMIVSLLLMTYVNASVNDWFGGGSFGSRRFCSSLALFALGLAAIGNLFRGRRVWIPAAVTGLAIAWNIVVLCAYSRRLFDPYFLGEMWALRKDLLAALPRWLPTIPLNCDAMIRGFLSHDWVGAMLIILLGILLIGGVLLLVRKRAFVFAEKRGAAIVGGCGAIVVILDLALLVFAPPRNEAGLLFAKTIALTGQNAEAKKQDMIRSVLRAGYSNPSAYLHAAMFLGEKAPLSDYLDAIYAISPKLWAKWILELPENRIPESRRVEARDMVRLAGISAVAVCHEKASAFRGKGESRQERLWLERAVHCDPFNPWALLRLAELSDSRKKYARANEYRSRLRRFLETKRDTLLAKEKNVGRWRTQFFEFNYLDHLITFARLCEDTDELASALEIYETIEQRRRHDFHNRQRKLSVKALLSRSDRDERELLGALDGRHTRIDTFVAAASLRLRHKENAKALAILRVGFKHHPEALPLSHQLRRLLRSYAPGAPPFADLLAIEIESPEYWLCVAESLNQARRFEDTLEVAKKFLALRPDHAWSHFVQGEAFYNLDKFPEAEAAFRRAFHLTPEYPTFGMFLSRALRRQAKNEEARRVVEQTIRKCTDMELLKWWTDEIQAVGLTIDGARQTD